MIVLDLDRALSLHVAVALDLHAKACRANGSDLPAGLEQLAARCWQTAKGDRDRLETTELGEIADLLHGRLMQLLLDLDEVAAVLHVGKRQVQRLVADGTLPSVTIGTSRRVRRVDLERYVDALGTRSFRAEVESKNAPASPSSGPVGRRVAGAGARKPARASLPSLEEAG